MKKQIVFTHEKGQNEFTNLVNEGLKQTKLIVEAWNRLPLENIKTVDQLHGLLSAKDLKQFAASMVPVNNEPVKFMGVTLKPEKAALMALDLMDLDFTEVLEMMPTYDRRPINVFLEVAKISLENGLEIDQEAFANHLDKFNIYATSDRQKEAAIALNTAIDSINKLIDLGALSVENTLNSPPANLWMRRNNDKIELNPNFYMKFFSA